MDYGSLARSYHPLQYSYELRKLLFTFYRNEDLEELTKFDLHKKINNILYRNYFGEEVLKYKLARIFIKKKYIAGFEVKVNSSRADFLVINGTTHCFEIKSKIDTLKRLRQQCLDYGDVFEFNTVVIDKIHLAQVVELLPQHHGIWYFEGNKRIIYRNASQTPSINSEAQLSLLTKKELNTLFNITNIIDIMKQFDKNQINNNMKIALKDRYSKRWDFVKLNWDKILPIDLQFFFNTNICPNIIYYD